MGDLGLAIYKHLTRNRVKDQVASLILSRQSSRIELLSSSKFKLSPTEPTTFLTSAVAHVNLRRVKQERTLQFFQMRLGVPRRAGRIGKRVRIPRGRATVKIVAFEATMQKPGDLPGRSCSFRTPRARVFRPPWEFSSQKRSRRQPVAFAWQKG